MTDAQYIHVGLVNNMPDSALEATERQFRSLLCEAESAEGIAVRLTSFAIAEIPRSGKARSRIDRSYLSIGELLNRRLDGLIVTGAEPIAQKLTEEPYWASLAQLIDWAEDNTYSSLWSCLAAHAAVLRKSGIERRRFDNKLFGVFASLRQSNHPLTAGIPSHFKMPHSRWNDLPEDALSACGYRILTQLQNGSVDIFLKQTKSLFICFQGHPEYDADSLLLEYRRDIRRFLNQERERYPSMPQGYFEENGSVALAGLQAQAVPGGCEQLWANLPAPLQSPNLKSTWRLDAIRFYRNWLRYLFERKSINSKSRTTPTEYKLNPTAMAEAGSLAQEADA